MKKKKAVFIPPVSKLLYLVKWRRQDIQNAVAFLCTRVKALVTDDYKKLVRVMQHKRDTTKLTLTITRWQSQMLVDRAHGSPRHKKSTISMAMGKWVTHTASWKWDWTQKLHRGRVSAMWQVLWTRYFFAAQGAHIPMKPYTKTLRVLNC